MSGGGWNPLTDSWGLGTGGWSGLETALKDTVKAYFEPIWDLHVKVVEESFRVFGFEGETIYTVQVINQPVIPDEQTPFTHKILLNHVLEQQNLVAGFQLSLTTGIHASVKKYLNYGETYYVNGVPTLTNSVSGIDQGAVDTALTDVEGAAVTVFSAVITYLPINEWIKWWLQENTLFTYHNSQIVVGSGTYEYTGYTDTSTDYTANFTLIAGTGPAGHTITGIPYEDDTKPYIIATYALDSAITLTKIWIYDRDSGVYPDLDPVDESSIQDSSVLPIVAVRKDFVNLNDPIHATEYDSARKLLKKLELPIEHIIDSLADPEDPNPPGDQQIDQIEDAFVYFGLNVYTEQTSVIRALRETFDYMEIVQTTDKITFDQQEPTSNPTPNVFSVTEANFNAAVQYNYIDTTSTAGSIGERTFADLTITILPNSAIVGALDPDSLETYGGLPQSYITIREQFDGYYLTTVVHGLTVATGIKTSPGNLKFQFQELEAPSINRNPMMIPLIMTSISDMSAIHQEQVLYEGITLTVYAQDSQYLEWYETPQFLDFFQIVIIVISVVIAIYSGGSAANILYEIVKNLMYQYALSLALKEILKHNLSDTEQAIVITLYVVAALYGASGFDFNFDMLTSAETYMWAVDSTTQALMMDTALEAETLAQDTEELLAKIESRQEILEAAESTYSKAFDIHPLMLVRSYSIDSYESPEQYYERAIHTGNPGVLSLDEIAKFHSKALELPELT